MKTVLFIALTFLILESCTNSSQKNTPNEKGKSTVKIKENKIVEISVDSLIPLLNEKFNVEKYHSYQQINFRVDFQLEGEEFLYFDVSVFPQSSEVYVKFDTEEQFYINFTGVKGNKEGRIRKELGRNIMSWLQVVLLPYNFNGNIHVVKLESGVKRYNMAYTVAKVGITEGLLKSEMTSAEILVESESRFLKLIQFEKEQWSFKKGKLKANALAYKNFMTLEGIPFARRISLMHISKEKERVIGEGRIKNIELLNTVNKPFSTRAFRPL